MVINIGNNEVIILILQISIHLIRKHCSKLKNLPDRIHEKS
jgi:hypothetical protein